MSSVKSSVSLRLAITLLLLGFLGCASRKTIEHVTWPIPACPGNLTLTGAAANCPHDLALCFTKVQSAEFLEWIAGWKECAKTRGLVLEEINQANE